MDPAGAPHPVPVPPRPSRRPGCPGPLPKRPSRWGRNRPINVNHYANKKSAAESMLDIALLMANASQLKAVIEQGPGFAFFVPLVVLISISLVLQIGVGVLLIFLGVSLERRLPGCVQRQRVVPSNPHLGLGPSLLLPDRDL
uniref:Ninjurin-1 n=1 Tax=Panthera tigris altaica TaxID=74533 RepID=A0A8C9JXZ5_PANTA